jgi:hypothetical protein
MAGEWQPISEERVWDKINNSSLRMNFQQRRLWDIIKIIPEKWSNEQKHYRHGSWVVAIMGELVVWYDDIDEEFANSPWSTYSVISATKYGGAELTDQLQTIWARFTGEDIGKPLGRQRQMRCLGG